MPPSPSRQMCARAVLRTAPMLFAASLLPAVAAAQSGISGTIRSATAAPLPNIKVIAVAPNGQYANEATSDGAGFYAIALYGGSYFIYTQNTSGFVNEIYHHSADVRCQIDCSPGAVIATGSPIPVAGGFPGGSDFTLSPGATISGTVTAEGGGPIATVEIHVSSKQGGLPQHEATAATNLSGAYSLTRLIPGTYYVHTNVTDGSVANEIYDNLPCEVGCSSAQAVTSGTALNVGPGGTATASFGLAAGAVISGTVTGAGGPLPGVHVQIYRLASGAAHYVTVAATDAAGVYTVAGLAAGTYFALTTGAPNHINEVYDNIPCPNGCSGSIAVVNGTPIVRSAGQAAPAVDFALVQGGTISGKVTNSGGAPLAGVEVRVIGPSSASAVSNAQGDYAVAGLPAGIYRAFTAATAGYVNEVFDNVTCPSTCPVGFASSVGAPIPVTLGNNSSGRNFQLVAGGTITGIMGGLPYGPIEGATVIAYVVQGGMVLEAGSTVTNSAGDYWITGLSGTFYLATRNTLGYINEILGDIPCLGECPASSVTLGRAIPVAPGETVLTSFTLEPGARIGGTVTNASTGSPIESVSVEVYSSTGASVTRGLTNALGAYVSEAGFPAGSYYISTAAATGFINEVYDNLPCAGECGWLATLAGTAVTVTAGSTVRGRDFALAPGGRIGGSIIEAGAGTALGGVAVNIYRRAGSTFAFAGTVSTNLAGEYLTAAGLPSGNYFAFTSNALGYTDEIFDDVACAGTCSPAVATTAGTAIAVTEGATTTGRDFALATLPRNGPPGPPVDLTVSSDAAGVHFAWQPPVSGGAATSYVVEAGLAPGATAVSIPGVGSTTYHVAGAPPGRYFVRVRGVNGAGAGAPSDEYQLTVGASGLAPPDAPINVATTMFGSRLTMWWDQPTSGGTPTDFLVEAGSGPGLADVATRTVSVRSFSYTPVPTGNFYLRVRARNAAGVSGPSREVLLTVNVAPPPAPPVNFGGTVSASTVTFGWAPGVGGPTSYVLEAGSAPGLSNIATFKTGSAATTVSFSNVPRGTYFVRLRAVNAAGTSAASNEVRLVVP